MSDEVNAAANAADTAEKAVQFGTDLKNQILCKDTVNGTHTFGFKALLTNAAAAVGGYFLGKKVIAPRVSWSGFLGGK